MPKGLLIFALCLPLAILMGFMLADPMMGTNSMVIGGIMFALIVPVVLAVHQRALIWFAGAFVNAFFLPGQPQMWMLIAGTSFLIAVCGRPLRKARTRPVWDKSVLVTLTLFICSVMITALLSGSIGLRILGSSVFGGRKYVMLLASVVGFLALTMQGLPRKHAQTDLKVFALSPATSAISNFAYMLGPNFYFLFLLFPVEMVMNQAMADLSPTIGTIKRYTGFSNACTAIAMFSLLKWGFKGILQPTKPWRIGLVLFGFSLGMISGFRSALLTPLVVMMVQFCAEGLYKTKYALGVGGFLAASLVFLAAFSESLPLAAQRAISFLPVRVDPVAAIDAKNSLAWRFAMWQVVLKEVPDHLWLGKGYAIDPADIYLAQESVKRGFQNDYELSVRTGDYHSGPLSVLVPFGIIGTITLILFVIACIRVLARNLKYGDPDIKNVNTFLFSYFVGFFIYFVIFFGGIEIDLWIFVSTVGLSLAVNGGVKAPVTQPVVKLKPEGGTLPGTALAPAPA